MTDTSGNALGTADTWTFTTPTGGATDTTVADFGAGTTGADTYVSETGNGEVILAPTVGAEFSGTSLPSGWESGPWTGGAANVAGGSMIVDGAWARTTALYDPGHVLEFRATFGDTTFLNGGLGVDLDTVSRWAMFGIGGSSGQLYVRVAGSPDVALGADYLGSPHTYRIEWTADAIRFYIDGSLVHTHDGAVTGQMRPILSDFNAGGPSLSVDWLRMSPYPATGTFTSRVLDAGADRVFDTIGWNATIPAGTSVEMSVRTGSTATPDQSWTEWAPVATSGSAIATVGRYTQYQAVLASDGLRTPALTDVTLGSVVPPNAAPVASAATNQDGTEGIAGLFDLGSFTDAGDAGPWDVTVDWGDGSTPGTFQVTSAGPIGTLAHTYTDDATYDVSVTVSDGELQDTQTFQIAVANAAPIVTAPADQTATRDQLVQIELGSFSDTGTNAGDWDVTVDWGDGSQTDSFTIAQAGSLGQRAHTFSTEAVRTVMVTVADDKAASNQATFTVTVGAPPNAAPVASAATNQDGTEGIAGLFDLGSFTDAGDAGPWDVTVDWGDGSTPGTFQVTSAGPIGTLAHTYTDDATYDVSVTVSDGELQDTQTFQIAVANAAPIVTAPADQTATRDQLVQIELGSFSDTGTNAGDWDVTVDWGDGSQTDSFTIAQAGSLGQRAHTFSTEAVRTVMVTVADDKAASNQATFTVTVGAPPNAAPVASDDAYDVAQAGVLQVPSPGVLANDIDANGDALTAVKVSDPVHGTVTLNADGSFTYTPDPAYSGNDTFTYRASDSQAMSNVGSVAIEVRPDTTPPSAPSELHARVTTTAIVLAWQANAEADIAGYDVFRRIDGTFVKLTQALLISPSYVDTSAPIGEESAYRVVAVDIVGNASDPATINVTRWIGLRGATTASNKVESSLVVQRPEGVRQGDVMIATISVLGAPIVSPPAGWAVIRNQADGTVMRQVTYAKVVGASEPATYSWTFPTGTRRSARLPRTSTWTSSVRSTPRMHRRTQAPRRSRHRLSRSPP